MRKNIFPKKRNPFSIQLWQTSHIINNGLAPALSRGKTETGLQNINCITHGYATTNPNITCFLLIYNKMDFSEFIKIDNIYL